MGSFLLILPGEFSTVMFALQKMLILRSHDAMSHPCTYIEISYEGVLAGLSPRTRRLHASWHSCTISVAYFLFLASPEKAKAFSGFPSAKREIQISGKVLIQPCTN